MVDPNWSLLQGNQSQQYFNNGAQLGSHVAITQRARELDNALASYVTNPQDQAAFGKITQLDPRMGMQLQERQQKASAEQRRRELIPLAARGDETALLELWGADPDMAMKLDENFL